MLPHFLFIRLAKLRTKVDRFTNQPVVIGVMENRFGPCNLISLPDRSAGFGDNKEQFFKVIGPQVFYRACLVKLGNQSGGRVQIFVMGPGREFAQFPVG